jgi:ATP-dependent exoDNAse (exonuclease V) alpha subunit
MAKSRLASFLKGEKKTFGQVDRSVAAATKQIVAKSESKKNSVSVQEKIQVLPEYLEVKELINESFPMILVTGGAGTGKSTFIRWLDREFKGQTLICAPTGIAALTVQGSTIHRLCKFPPSWIVDGDIQKDPKSLAKYAKILIIDEISMVNANLLDSVNKFFQLNRGNKKAFGGICVVMVGDLFQLPPIVTQATRELFESLYESPKFFSADALMQSEYYFVELSKAFRQVDQEFVDLLSKIREGRNLSSAISTLNNSCKITDTPPPGTITLSPRHADIERVNNERLKRLPGKIKVFNGVFTGRFSEKQVPVPNKIELKVGAQVMIAKNGKNYVNGDVATVTEIFADRVKLMLTDRKEVVEVPISVWQQFEYKLNEKTKEIERVISGSYSQLPVVLAWAMTIHKSQGLTLSSVHLDLGKGAFETGQTYVALSRCRSLKTLSLARPIRSGDILVDSQAIAFYKEIRE